jgi:hypothetical protein
MANIQNFYSNCSYVFTNFLKAVIYSLMFEDHKNVWIF